MGPAGMDDAGGCGRWSGVANWLGESLQLRRGRLTAAGAGDERIPRRSEEGTSLSLRHVTIHSLSPSLLPSKLLQFLFGADEFHRPVVE